MWAVDQSPRRLLLSDGALYQHDEALAVDRLALRGAINETLTFRFTIRTGPDAVSSPALHVAPFEKRGGRIDPSAVQLFRMHPVSITRWPGWHVRSIPRDQRQPQPLDVLVPIGAPRGGLPKTLEPGRTYHFWADLHIPKGTFVGEYAARLELRARGTTLAGVELRLTVDPIILPDAADVAAIAEVDHHALFRHHADTAGFTGPLGVDDWRDWPQRDRFDALLGATMRLLHSHGVTPVPTRLAPIVKVDASGQLRIDWGQYDAVVEPLLSGRAFFGRATPKHWPLPLPAMLEGHRAGAELSPGFTRLLEQYIRECAAHFEQKGWLARSYLPLPDIDPAVDESVEFALAIARIAQRADPRVPIMTRCFPQDMTPLGWVDYATPAIDSFVKIWAPPAQFYDPVALAAQRERKRRTWLSVDRPPFSGSLEIFAPPAFVRVLSWQASQLGAETLLLGPINNWPTDASSTAPQQCIEHDPGVLLYPGGPFGLDEPVPSVRLKRLRRSLQDAAYVKVLRRHGLNHIVRTLTESLSPRAGVEAYRTHFADGRAIGWSDRLGAYELARRVMADALLTGSQADGGDSPTESLERQANWRRFMPAVRRLEIGVDGARVRLQSTTGPWKAEVTVAVTVHNGLRVPISGTLSVTDLPAAWSGDQIATSFGPVAPNGSRRAILRVHMPAPPLGRSGITPLSIELATDDDSTIRSNARVAFITAVPRDVPISVDGDLSDWPPGIGNVASDFVPIARVPSEDSGSSDATSRNETFALVMRDADYLYFAINSKADRREPRARSMRNTVRYDDLVPVGDELVEILVDPLNAGTRSPGDLFRLAIKPSGTYLAERGLRTDPPCNRRRAWPCDAAVATKIIDDRWMAEVRIPLSAFGQAPTTHTIWGLNFTRFDAAAQEFSTWSGATGNAYDPLSLGNLYLP